MNPKERLVYMYSETRRILRLTRKPKRSEYGETAKVTGIGIILIGFVGFLVFFIAQVLRSI